jgi:Rrf2 family transcriptional regulator, iron-sulfur cluster assembly transcription factor
MIYSNTCSYAIHAMTRLALMRPDGYVLINELCAGTDLPRPFVTKILHSLVCQGLLISAKGLGGGFALRRPPSEISLHDIVVAVDGVDSLESCAFCVTQDNDPRLCPMHKAWAPIGRKIDRFLVETTLRDMSKSLAIKLKSLGRKMPEPQSESKP